MEQNAFSGTERLFILCLSAQHAAPVRCRSSVVSKPASLLGCFFGFTVPCPRLPPQHNTAEAQVRLQTDLRRQLDKGAACVLHRHLLCLLTYVGTPLLSKFVTRGRSYLCSAGARLGSLRGSACRRTVQNEETFTAVRAVRTCRLQTCAIAFRPCAFVCVLRNVAQQHQLSWDAFEFQSNNS